MPSTLKFIKEAGIKFWILTGDKKETAKTIARSSGLLDDSMELHTIEGSSPADISDEAIQI